MNRDYQKELQNFKAVWKRVSGEAQCETAGKNGRSVSDINLMPRKAPKSRSSRFGPPR